ncbi:heavy metal transporter [Microbacterium sp. bgisy189]|uniref:heavy metal transporter n=1 Tax=Microbacterium sp. bgisy189 TaxID=3413798 RepID=UPI003EBA92DC
MTGEAPKRVRVTGAPARPAGSSRSDPTRGIALPGAPADEADAVYSRALRRTQLRLALGTVAGFVVVVVAMTVALVWVPELDDVAIAGIPLSWLLHAFAFYPVIALFALLYARAATRNEQRYRALQERP